MKRLAELTIFVSLAVALHLLLAMGSPEEGGDAGGAGGDSYVTLAGAPAQIETVLEDWTRPPERLTELAVELDQPDMDATDTPAMPALVAEASPNAAVQIAALLPTDRPQQPDLTAMQAPLPLPPELAPPEVIAQPAPQMPELPKQTPTEDVAPRTLSQPRPEVPQVETALAKPDLPPPPPEPDQKPDPKPELKPAPKPQPKKEVQKADKAQKASPGAAAQKAAGASGGAQAGTTGKSKALGKGQEARHMSVWAAKIQSRIERNKRYPRGGKGNGVVYLKLSLAPSGQLLSVQVGRSSGDRALDQAAVQAVKRAGRFAKAHKQLTNPNYGFDFKLRFKR